MTFPRTHTWLHLLARDVSFDCPSGPQWLRGPLEEQSSAGGRRVLVEFEQLSPQTDADAVVAINCRAGNDAIRKRFPHLRRFAVLPGWENPRWFIPLTSPAVSSAGFNLYTPARALARLKRAAARAAVYTRLPFWYRDQIMIAQRQPPPLEQAMARLFPHASLSFALSSGAPEGARNRKASAAVIDEAGHVLAFLKLAGSDLSQQLLRHEAQVLRELAVRADFDGLAPKLLAADEMDGTYVTAQGPLAGGPGPTTFTEMHARFLGRLTPGNPVSTTQTQFVRALPDRIAALPQPHPELLTALEQATAELEIERVPAGIIHGDFAPWNLRRTHNRITAFDWEYASLDGPAGIDEIHYRLQVGYLLENWSVERALHELLTPMLPNNPPGGRRASAVLYLVDILTRLFAEGYDQTNEMVTWNMRLLSHLRAAAPREAALA